MSNIPHEINYQGMIYRPPSEAHNILIQATLGCSYANCTFCHGYGDQQFALKDQAILEQDLAFAETYCRRQDRLFVLDGNAFCMPMDRWEWLLNEIKIRLPWVQGVGCFASALDVKCKTDADLHKLRDMGLDRIYLGIESGHPDILQRVKKGISADEILIQSRRLLHANMNLLVTVLLGIAGPDLSLAHGIATGVLLSKICPHQVSVMTLIRMPDTPIDHEISCGALTPLDGPGILRELRELLIHTKLSKALFDVTHASNYVSFSAQFPEQKWEALAYLNKVLAGNISLKEDASRRL